MWTKCSNIGLKVFEKLSTLSYVLSIVSEKFPKLKNRKAFAIITHGQAKCQKAGILLCPTGNRPQEPLVALPDDINLQNKMTA